MRTVTYNKKMLDGFLITPEQDKRLIRTINLYDAKEIDREQLILSILGILNVKQKQP